MQWNNLLGVLFIIVVCVWVYRKYSLRKVKQIDRKGKVNYNPYSIDDRYNDQRKSEQEELNKLLDKIANKGMDSLNKQEKDRLEILSKR